MSLHTLFILTSICISLLTSLRCMASDLDETKKKSPITANSIGIDLRPSWVAPTSGLLKGDERGERQVWGAFAPHLRYSFKFNPENTRVGQLYPHTYQGIGVAYTQFFKKAMLGHPVNLYLFQGSKITSLSENLSLDYEWNFGASAGWKKFDPVNNVEGGPIGSHVNAYISLSFLLSYKIDHRWKLIAGVEGSHYSNGNTHLPNSGVNLFGARVGVTYTTGEDKSASYLTLPTPEVRKKLGYDLTIYGATRQRIYYADKQSTGEYIPGSFGVVGLNFAPMYRFNKYLRTGVSADLQYDESANISKYHVEDTYGDDIKFYRQPFKDRFSAGLSLHAELTMPIFSVNVGIGRNVIASGPDTRIFYQTLALKAYVIKGVFLQAGYQLRNFHDPNNLMLGIGYTFGNR
ncbi:MAG: acyloxyacyl hydrolase [Muribaculum sp.]|nr:acyloxyacyl hydrolase [Muribaculum sp.]